MSNVQFLEAVYNNDVVTAERLLKQGANVNERHPSGLTPLMVASGFGNAQMVKLLLDAGADVLTGDPHTGATALHKAAHGGNPEVARLLVEAGAFIDLQMPTTGHTPLIEAIWYKQIDVVKYLLDRGANLNLDTHYGFTFWDFLNFALNVNIVGKDKLLKIKELIDERRKADEEKIQSQKLMAAVRNNDLATVKQLIEEGVDVNERYPVINSFFDGHTALLVAARDGYKEIVRELLKARARIDMEDYIFKGVPIHKATYMGNPEILQMLVEHPGINVDVQGVINGYTPVHDAIWHGYADCAKICIDAGAKLDLKGHDGKTPLDVAIEVFGPEGEIPNIIREKLGLKQSIKAA